MNACRTLGSQVSQMMPLLGCQPFGEGETRCILLIVPEVTQDLLDKVPNHYAGLPVRTVDPQSMPQP